MKNWNKNVTVLFVVLALTFFTAVCRKKGAPSEQPPKESTPPQQTAQESVTGSTVDKPEGEVPKNKPTSTEVKAESATDVKRCIEMLQSANPKEKYAAMIELRRIGPKASAAIDPLFRLLSDGTQFWALKSGPLPVTTESGWTVVSGESAFGIVGIGWEAAKTLVIIDRSPNLLPRLIGTLGSDDTDAQESACIAFQLLGKGATDAVPSLIPLLRQEKGFVSSEALDALKKITGQDIGKNPDAWEKWWTETKKGKQPENVPPATKLLAGEDVVHQIQSAIKFDLSPNFVFGRFWQHCTLYPWYDFDKMKQKGNRYVFEEGAPFGVNPEYDSDTIGYLVEFGDNWGGKEGGNVQFRKGKVGSCKTIPMFVAEATIAKVGGEVYIFENGRWSKE